MAGNVIALVGGVVSELNVTVTLFCPPPSAPVEQGFVLAEQVPSDEVQPAKEELPFGVACNEADGVPVMLRVHEPTIVTDDVPFPVAPVQAPLPVVG